MAQEVHMILCLYIYKKLLSTFKFGIVTLEQTVNTVCFSANSFCESSMTRKAIAHSITVYNLLIDILLTLCVGVRMTRYSKQTVPF